MHGTVFAEFRNYVSDTYGAETWTRLVNATGARGEYEPLSMYPDEELMALLGEAVTISGRSEADLLFDFGVFVAPSLIRMYWGAIQPEWRTLDVVQHTEDTIHRLVRLREPSAEPPYMHAIRTAESEVDIIYTSRRNICPFAKGIVHGLAGHYRETIEIDDHACMRRGDEKCTFTIRKTGDLA